VAGLSFTLEDRLRGRLHRRRHPERFALLDRLLENAALSTVRLHEKQRDELAAIVAYAAANTDFYAERFGDKRALTDLPILTKSDVRDHRDRMLARDADRSRTQLGYTGGSTGQPLAFWWDSAKHELMRAGMMRSYMASGWRPGDRILNFWGARQDIRKAGFAKRWGEWVTSEKTLDAREYDAATLRAWAEFIRAWRPVLLQGYASILAALARHVIAERIAMSSTLVGVYSTAEMLDDAQRQTMEQAFGCRVFNQYGSREIPNIACECRNGNMHVFTDMVYLESLPAGDGDADQRCLIVTSLTNRLMPMIRYEIGDSGRLKDGECGCGWPFPLMEIGVCRKNDLIRTATGRHIHPSFFNGLLYGFTQVRQYQFVQTAPDRIILNLVTAAPLPPERIADMQARIHKEADAAMTLQVRYVDEISPTASGKRRFVVSQCS
jgi:phenylacetate-CoA ligase